MENQSTNQTLKDIFDELSKFISNKIIKREFQMESIDKGLVVINIESFHLKLWIDEDKIRTYSNVKSFVPKLILTEQETKEFKEYIFFKYKEFLEFENLKKQTEENYKKYLELKELFEPNIAQLL